MSFLDDITEYKKIGEGSYGSVYRSKATGYAIKKCKIHELNIIEIIYMKSLEAKCGGNYRDYIPTIIKANMADANLYITMNYCGVHMSTFANYIPYERRIRFIPSIISQMAKFLMWLKENKLVHMDIKCENICVQSVGENIVLKFIDFGFASIYCKHSDSYVGTHSYADPKFITESKNHQICPAYDMFSCGITIASFISKKYINARRDFLTELYFNIRIEDLYQDMNYAIGQEYVSILRRMLDLDALTRITVDELYAIPVLSICTNLTPPPKKEETIALRRPIVPTDITKEMKNYLIANILAVCKKTKNTHLFHYTIVLFYKVFDSMELTAANYELYGMTCLILANWILHAKSNENMIQLKFIVDFVFEKKINKTNILITMINICEAIDWQFFSIYDFSYWDMDLSDEWFEKLYIPIDQPFCEHRMAQIESFIVDSGLVCPNVSKKRPRECSDIVAVDGGGDGGGDVAVDVAVDGGGDVAVDGAPTDYITPPTKRQNIAD